MKLNFIWTPLVVAGFVFLSSCGEDEDPKSGITFEATSQDVKESNGALESFHPILIPGATGQTMTVKVVLDRKASQTTVVNYSVKGTATRNTAATVGDYEIEGTTLTIEKGATEAFINLTIFEDGTVEKDELNANGTPFETILITLESVVSGAAVIGEQKAHTINVLEDDVMISLKWNSHQATAAGDVDMDLFLWYDHPEDGYVILDYSTQSGNKFEEMAIPAGFPDLSYGFSYTYYSGTSDNVDLTVAFTNYGGNLNNSSAPMQFTANRNLTNINKYDDEDSPDFKGDPVMVQTMDKVKYNYTDISQIGTPGAGTGSRAKGGLNLMKNNSANNKLKLPTSLLKF